MENKKTWIRIWAEDFDTEVWYDYCDIAGVPHDAAFIVIYFDAKEVEYDSYDNDGREDEKLTMDFGDYLVIIKHPDNDGLDEYRNFERYSEAKEFYDELTDALIKKDINNGLYVSYAKVHEVILMNEGTGEEYDCINL